MKDCNVISIYIKATANTKIYKIYIFLKFCSITPLQRNYLFSEVKKLIINDFSEQNVYVKD